MDGRPGREYMVVFLGEEPTNMAPFTFTKKAMLTECIHSNLHERKVRKNTI